MNSRALPTARDLALLEMPSLDSQMPVQFANGTQWHSLECECRSCGKVLPIRQVRGAITRQTAHMATMEAVGVCHDCKLLTRFVYRLHDDMRMTGPRQDGWHTWGGQQTGLIQRLKRLLGIGGRFKTG